MKVLFLDVDGVLNNFKLIGDHGFDYIDEDMVCLLSSIVSATDAKIVLSSYWRLKQTDREMVGSALGRFNMHIMDVTPSISIHMARHSEISSWLSFNKEVETYAILDDNEDAGIGMEHSFFQTDGDVGITNYIASKVICHLKGEVES